MKTKNKLEIKKLWDQNWKKKLFRIKTKCKKLLRIKNDVPILLIY